MKLRYCLILLLGGIIGLSLGEFSGYRLGLSRRDALVATAPLVAAHRAPAGSVYFYGPGIREGALPLSSGPLTASQAIISEGGLKNGGDGRHVYIVRQASAQTIPVDFDAITGGDLGRDPALRSGDVVVVPERLVNF